MTDFKFHCPGCNQKMRATDDMIGDQIDCPVCRYNFKVPAPAPGNSKCHFCRGAIPADSVFCDLCGKLQPDTGADGDKPAAGQSGPPAMDTDGAGRTRVFKMILVGLGLIVLAAVLISLRTCRPDSGAADDIPAVTPADPPPRTAQDSPAPVAQPPRVRDITDQYTPTTPMPAPDDDEDDPEAAPMPPVRQPPATPPARPADRPQPDRPVRPPPPVTPPPPQRPDDEDDADKVDETMVLFERTRERYKEVLEKIEQDHLQRINDTRDILVKSMETLERNMQERGELMGVLAVRKAREEFMKLTAHPPVIRNTASDFPEITKLQTDYNQRLTQLDKDRAEEKILRARQYDARLAALERQLTQEGKIDEALEVHAEREAVRKAIGR